MGWGVGSVATRVSGGEITSVKWNFAAEASRSSCCAAGGVEVVLAPLPPLETTVLDVVVTLVVVVVVVPSWETEVCVEGEGD